MFEPISVSLLPNNFQEDANLALKLLFSPGNWTKGDEADKLEKDFEELYPGYQAISFLSGRGALLAILKSLEIEPKSEVILQAFTCVVVPNAILKAGDVPVYVDIEEDTFNLNPKDLEKKITPKTRVLIVQHTFGCPAKMESILKIAKKHNLIVIEDCAHTIGTQYQGHNLGTFGEAAFFSFGRDKVISSVFGGMAITRNKKIGKKLKKIQSTLTYPSKFWIFRQLLYLPVMSQLLAIYNFFSLGKILIFCLQRLRILLKPVEEKEKKGIFPAVFFSQLPNSLASLARKQLTQLPTFNQSRQKLTYFYSQQLKDLPLQFPPYRISQEILPLLRFTIKVQNPQALYEYAKSRGVLLNNWYYPAISPSSVDNRLIKYDPLSCPVAEETSRKVVNLPTHPRLTLKEARKVVGIIRDFFN